MYSIAILVDNITNKAGTERAVVNFCDGVLSQKSNFKITIISFFSKESEEFFFSIPKNVSIIHLGITNNFTYLSKIVWYTKLVKKLKIVAAKNTFNLLMGTTYVHNILLPVITRKTKIKTIGCEHEIYNYPSRIIKRIRKMVYPKLDAVIVLNKTEYKHFSFLKNVYIIPNSLSFKATGVSNLSEKKIIAVGRLTYQKGFDLLIDIMREIVVKYPEWQLCIFGEGEDLGSLNDLIKVNNLDKNINVCSPVKNISEEYKKSSIFVLTSRWESFGLVLLEAMNHKLGVVSFDCDGPTNIINDGLNGFLVPKLSIQGFAQKVITLIENKKLLDEMALQAYNTSLNYEQQKITKLWITLINQLQSK